MVDSPSDNIQTHKVLGPNSPRGRVGGPKSLENPEKVMVHSPNDALQSHKVSGQNSPRGRVGGQNSLKNPGNPEKLSQGRAGGGGVLGWATTLGQFGISPSA